MFKKTQFWIFFPENAAQEADIIGSIHVIDARYVKKDKTIVSWKYLDTDENGQLIVN